MLVPGDRANAAAIGPLSITDNVTMPVLASTFSRWRLARGKMLALAEDLGRRFEVLPNRPQLPINALSGGNQQKVMLAKWLQQSPRLLLLDEPTQGVDIGARQAVFAQIHTATKEGATVLCGGRRPEGLPPASAADKLAWLLDRMRALRASGVALKDEQPPSAAPLPAPA